MKHRIPSLLITLMLYNKVAAQEGPGIVIAHPGQDVELLCTVTGAVPAWRVNGEAYTLSALFMGQLTGHNSSGNNIIVEDIMMNDSRNGSVYICVIPQISPTPDIEGNPTILYVAGVPAMVPDVTVHNNTINRKNVTLTLSWGEPFNNLDPIVNYIVSCSDDVTCPPNFTTTDNTTRSYTITNLTPMTNYTFSVEATNSIGSGEAGVVMITTPPGITGVTLTCGPVDMINQCNVMWNPVTQGDITGYRVYYNGTMNITNLTTLTFNAPSLPDGVFTGTVVVMVTAFTRFGIGPVSDNVSETFTASSVIAVMPSFVPVISELYNITFICTVHCDSTANQCVLMAMADGEDTKTGYAHITNGMAAVTVFNLQCNVSYNITAGGRLNGKLVGPRSSHGNVDPGPCPTTAADESDNQLVPVAISTVVTFIITLVVTALITLIITSLYYKHLIDHIKQSVIRQEGDSHALTEDIKSNDPTRANITMNTNPAYGTATTIKMDTNPAYATATSN